MLTEEGRKIRNEYAREWAKRNREKRKASNDEYWNRLAERRSDDNGTTEEGKA